MPLSDLIKTHDDPTVVSVLLTCGHYHGPVHECSSTFDFPEDPLACPDGCGDRLMHLDLLRFIYDGMDA